MARSRTSVEAAAATLCALVAAIAFIPQAFAQFSDTRDDAATELEAIIVSGARVETPLKETPQTIDVISEEEVAAVKYRNAGELLKRVPGVFTQNLNGEEELTSIRVPTHFSNPYTLLLIDGLPAATYGEAAGGLLREINSSNIQSIEVIKGPASALYGSNAIGGVINVITRSPSPEPWIAPWAEYGEYDQYRGGISGGGLAGPFGFNADVMAIDAEEWREHAAHEKQAGTFRGQYAPSDASLLDFKLEYIHLDNETAGTLSEEDYEHDWRQSDMTFTEVQLEKVTPSLICTTDLAGGELKTAALVRSVDHEVNPNYGIRYNGRTRRYTSYLSKIDALDYDLQVLYAHDLKALKAKYIGGVDFERGSSDIETYDLVVTRDPASGRYTSFVNTGLGESFEVKTRVAAPYLQLISTPVEKLGVSLGGRYDMVEYDVEDNLDTGGEGEQDFSRFSPKIGLTYDLHPKFNLFTSYSQGFVVPTVSQRFTGRGSNKDIEPEKADNYEAGFRSLWWQDRIKLDLSFYYMVIEDKIIVQTIDAVTSAIEYRNVGETSHRGVESTLEIKPWDWLNLLLAYTYAENKYEEFEDPVTGIDFSGNDMPLSAANRINARVKLMPFEPMQVELEMDYTDEYFVDDANSDTYDRPTLYNLRGSYDWRNWSLWAHVLNLSDEKYATRVTASNGIFSFFPGNPRTLFVGLSYHWGRK